MKKITLLLILSFQLSAQHLKYIPDMYLRFELQTQGFTTNDSLDLRKVQGRLQLDIVGKSVENLNGLQYFEQVWRLNISDNLVKTLNYLPPNLNDLDCSRNKITQINSLPKNLISLRCSKNEIYYICPLPNSVKSFDFQENKMTHLPQLSNKLETINFFKNPMSIDSLPPMFKNIECDNEMQNCMPYELLSWKILDAKIKNPWAEITGFKVSISVGYSWGFGSEGETIEFKKHKSNFVAKTIQIRRVKDKKDSSYFTKIDYSFKESDLKNIIQDMYDRKLKVDVKQRDTLKVINLEKKKNGYASCSSMCSDCAHYTIQYLIYTKADTLKITYGFNSGGSSKLTICSYTSNEPVSIKDFADWLYFYKIANLTMPKQELIRTFFNDAYLDNVIKWAKVTNK